MVTPMLRIAFVLLIAVAPVGHCQSPTLPPLPRAVWSQLGYVRVVAIPGLKCGTREALGCWDEERRVILVRDSLPLLTAWATLLHEQAHVAMWDSGVHSMLDDEKQEDAIADALAASRLAEMLAQLARKP